MKVCLSQAKEQVDSSALGLQPCSAEWLRLLNEAIQRLIQGPETWWECVFKMRVAVLSGCITWPRNVASIQSIAMCGVPISTRNLFFEFLESGYGIRCCNTQCDYQLLDKGTGVTFRDIRHGYTVKLVSETAEDADLEMGLLGYDCEGNWIRTTDEDGNWRDGVWIPVPTSPNAPYTGQQQFALGAITEIIKPVTNNNLLLYDYNVLTGDSQQIGVYEWDEIRPVYRKSQLGGVPTTGTTYVDVLYKQEFKPARNDNDFLLIDNIPAISEMMQAVQLYRSNNMQLASGHEAKAYQILDRAVQHYVGNGTGQPLRIDYRTFGAGSVLNLY